MYIIIALKLKLFIIYYQNSLLYYKNLFIIFNLKIFKKLILNIFLNQNYDISIIIFIIFSLLLI